MTTDPTVSAPTRPSSTGAALTLIAAECKLLRRNTTVWVTALAIPVLIGVAWMMSGAPVGEGLGAIVASQMVMILGFTVHTVGVMTLAARRQTLVLKRWRTTQASDGAILVGSTGLLAVLAFVQAVLLGALSSWVSSELPVQPLALVLGLVTGIAAVGGLTFVVASRTRTAEHSMITTGPLLICLMGVGAVVLSNPVGEVGIVPLLLPGGGPTELVRMGWTGIPEGGLMGTLVPAAAAAVVTAALSVWAAMRFFRWEPRS